MITIALFYLMFVFKQASSYKDIVCQWESKTGAFFGRLKLFRRFSSNSLSVSSCIRSDTTYDNG
jgi:hypothetical protein